MKKSIVSLVLACLAIFCFTACGNSGEKTQVPLATTPVPIRTPDPNVATPQSATPQSSASTVVSASPSPRPTIQPGQHTYAGEILSNNQLDLYYCDKSADNGVIVINNSLAFQIFPTTEFKAIYVSCPSMNDDKGTLIFDIYQWMGSYESTLEGTPILSETFEDYKDNTLIMLAGEQPFADGEYLVYITTPDPENGVGVWTKLSDFEGQKVYIDDELIEGVNINVQIRYINTPQNHFGPLSE
ncbi:MAG: hypothetical protein J5950_03550 [Clostridia bacterium]|nr:hypothetical protein [Clostridia bacterium]